MDCPVDTYNNIKDNILSQCISCPKNYKTQNIGSASLAECKSKFESSIFAYDSRYSYHFLVKIKINV